MRYKLSKEVFVKLAEACVAQHLFEEELNNTIRNIWRKHNVATDFLGETCNSDIMKDAIYELLGEDFSYWMFDCDRDWDTFCQNTTMPDGSHPDVHNIAELYDQMVGELQ